MSADYTSISFSSDLIPDITNHVNVELLFLKTEWNQISYPLMSPNHKLSSYGVEKGEDIENVEPQNLQIPVD